jgi:hypothetical protein
MHEYAKAHGLDIDFGVGEHGGNRHTTKASDTDKSN